MAQLLGNAAIGTVVKLNESESPVEYLVVQKGLPSGDYDSSCNGAWLLRRDVLSAGRGSAVDDYLASFVSRYDFVIRGAIKQAKIPYAKYLGNNEFQIMNGADGMSVKAFNLSAYEVGFTVSNDSLITEEGAKLAYFESGTDTSANSKRVANGGNGHAQDYWLRTGVKAYNNDRHAIVSSTGALDRDVYSNIQNVRPVIILPFATVVLDDGSLFDVLTPPSTLTTPQAAMQSNQITVSWTAVGIADGYILERKSNTDADWVQVYSGANLTFSEVVETWTSVQYRVKAGVEGVYGDYATSASIPVVPASALVISGSDGNLGTLVNDVSYTVSSDGTNPLTVTEIINGTTARTFTATNGANNKISVMDLPTGTGTIKITASTNPGSGVVTVTRNWTYTKTAPTFANAGSTAQLFDYDTKENIFPLTLLECVRGAENLAPGGFGLGTVAVNISDLNDATKNGWYMNGAGGEAVHAPDNVPGWLVLVCAYADEIVFQTAYRYGSDEGLMSARRSHHYLFGGWQPWEWINPPTLLGVEYRTVERYNGKPVYVKAINFGQAPNATYKEVSHGIEDFSQLVSYTGMMGGANLIEAPALDNILINASIIRITTNTDASRNYVYLVLRYTKTTD